MKPFLRTFSARAGRPNAVWLALVLLLVVLGPSVCLLWFVNEAVQNERLAVRQKLSEAYRGHLSLAQTRLEAHWQKWAKDLEAQAQSLSALQIFAREVLSGNADAVVCYDASGELVYPNSPTPPATAQADPAWAEAERLEDANPAAAAEAFARLTQGYSDVNWAARALQAQARGLVKSGQNAAAVAVLLGPLAEERFQRAQDSRGRLIVPNAELMALELLKDSDPAQARVTRERLQRRLSDYSDASLSSPQRRFLMHELQALFPKESSFPTLAAEDLAAQYCETPASEIHQAQLQSTAMPGVWQFASSQGRVITLHKTEELLARMQRVAGLELLPADAAISVLPPGKDLPKAFLTIAAGPELPGWRMALSLQDQQLFEVAANERIADYVWKAILTVGTVLALGLLALRLLRRQMALTQLRTDLVANVTHELKTPLASMRLLVDTLLESEKLDEQTAREYLTLIARENARLSRLIDNFLAFSRMERNKRAFEFRTVPASAILEGAAAAVRERFHEAGCQFEVQAPPGLPAVSADADAMVTALVNLLDNAYKYTGDQKHIQLSAAAENGNVCFAVKDNGIGLAPRETKRIFKRFYQVDQRLSRTGSGCGLGLSIVKFIVTAHRGSIRVESELGRGSRFIISLPCLEHQVSEARPEPAPAVPTCEKASS